MAKPKTTPTPRSPNQHRRTSVDQNGEVPASPSPPKDGHYSDKAENTGVITPQTVPEQIDSLKITRTGKVHSKKVFGVNYHGRSATTIMAGFECSFCLGLFGRCRCCRVIMPNTYCNEAVIAFFSTACITWPMATPFLGTVQIRVPLRYLHSPLPITQRLQLIAVFRLA